MQISAKPDHPGPLAQYVERTLAQARVIRAMMFDTVVPNLLPGRRGCAERIPRRINGRRVVDEAMLDELLELIRQLESEVTAGTHEGWQADEHRVRGGWPTTFQEDRTAALAGCVCELRRFDGMIAATLDPVAADALMLRLLSDT